MDIETRIKIIDEKLETIFHNIDHKAFNHFLLDEDEKLMTYDFIVGNVELGLFNKDMYKVLTNEILDHIENIIDNKLKELDLL